MTVPTGPASLQDIQTEFGGSAPIGLNEYYAGGGLVQNPGPTSAYQIGIIPTSGTISIGNFLGVKKAFVFNDTVSSNLLTGYSLVSRAVSAGWDQVAPLIATVTVNYGVNISGPNTGYAFTTAKGTAYPAGSQLTLINNGNIIGGGGNGGTGGSATGNGPGNPNGSFTNGGTGGNGGPGLFFDSTLTAYVTNTGTIGGGGGGGGGGNAIQNAGVVSSKPGIVYATYGAGGGGGGGGADFASAGGAGGSGGTATNNDGNYPGSVGSTNATQYPSFVAGNPAAYNVSPSIYGYGAGGAGGVLGGVVRAGTGGGGGEPGMPGLAGEFGDQNYVSFQSLPGAGGSPGAAIVGITGAVTFYNYGNIRGSMNSLGVWGSGGTNGAGLLGTHYTTPIKNTRRNTANWTAALGPVWYWNSVGTGETNTGVSTPVFYLLYSNPNAPFTAELYGACDNQMNSATINGAAIGLGGFNGNSAAFTTTYSTSAFTVPTGLNVIIITVSNTSSSIAGFNIRLRTNPGLIDLTHPSMWYY